MKIFLCLVFLASAALGADHLTTGTATGTLFSGYVQTPTLSIACGVEYIVINYTTGEVTIPKGATMPEAARAFWLGVAKAYPEARAEIVRSQPNTLVLSDADLVFLRDILKATRQAVELMAQDAKAKGH